MALHFPHRPDIRLENSPLIEVVCQVRFPPILRIANEEPSEFQEHIRERFPGVEIEQGMFIRFPGLGNPEPLSAEAQPKLYRFRTEDRQTITSLALDFYALSTSRYSHWRDFASDLKLVSEAIHQVYHPLYSTRIGLRYINRFNSGNTGAQTSEELFDLLQPQLTCKLRSEAWSDPSEMVSQIVIPDNGAKLTLRTAYQKEGDHPSFLLDFDYYEEGKLPLEELVERCNRYHQIIYDAFRWCICEDKLPIFRPVGEEGG